MVLEAPRICDAAHRQPSAFLAMMRRGSHNLGLSITALILRWHALEMQKLTRSWQSPPSPNPTGELTPRLGKKKRGGGTATAAARTAARRAVKSAEKLRATCGDRQQGR